MLDPSRHTALRAIAWNAGAVRSAIDGIVADALTLFDAETFWPAHPADDDIPDGDTSFYLGATGIIWALEHLKRIGATDRPIDFRPHLDRLVAANKTAFAQMEYAAHGSLLFGDMGTALLAMRLAPTNEHAALIERRARANSDLPIRELMWGLPGSMLACIHMAEMTGEERWRTLFETQAARLLGELEDTEHGPLWMQDLYGRRMQWLGPVHGYAGNMIPLLRGWKWLTATQQQRVASAVPETLAKNAWTSELGATWHGVVTRELPPHLCQHCHGAPGMVTTFADAPFSSPELESLLLAGGEFTFAAGPLAKGSNLCHGTGGNGYALLKLYRRTGDPPWLERARAFAMTAIDQCDDARAGLGRGRFSLWTGDVGLAIYLWDCLTERPRFPTVDVF